MSQLVNWTVEETLGGLEKVRKVEQLFPLHWRCQARKPRKQLIS
jgi:hypothetical protein